MDDEARVDRSRCGDDEPGTFVDHHIAIVGGLERDARTRRRSPVVDRGESGADQRASQPLALAVRVDSECRQVPCACRVRRGLGPGVS